MKRSFVILSLMALAPALVLAQANVTTVQSPEIREALPENLVAPQQVYVVQNPAPTMIQAPAVRTQPVSVIEDTPLRESRADQMRKSRIEVEQATEARIVEKLEQERMKAEQERADKLLKSLEGKKEEAPQVVAPVVAAPPVQPNPFVYPSAAVQPVPVVAPPVVVAEPAPVVSVNTVKDVELDKEEITKEEPKFFVSGMAGFADYPGVANIKGQYAAGFNAGIAFPERLIVEGSLIFSKYKMEEVPSYIVYNAFYPNIKEMEQTNITGGLKYQILDGRIRPTVGVLAGYTRRDYRNKQYYYGTNSGDIRSHAFDMGLSGGGDVALSDNFQVGADLKYMFNLSYDVDSDYEVSFANKSSRKSPEELEYYLFTVGAKLQF